MSIANEGNTEWGPTGVSSIHHGYVYGSRYPSLEFHIGGPALPRKMRQDIGKLLTVSLKDFHELEPIFDLAEVDAVPEGREWRETLAWMLRLFDSFQDACGLPVCEPARALQVEGTSAHCQVACCNRSLQPLSQIIGLVLKLIQCAGDGNAAVECVKEIESSFTALNSSGFKGGNVPRFIRAAHTLGIPFKEQPGHFFRFGDGRSGFWMDSSFTQRTGHISARLAGDKAICSSIIRRAGLPAPVCQVVANVEQAIKVAEGIGFPVVVKPANAEGGNGVSANLNSVEEVARGFQLAAKISKRIMVEKHVAGRDYRLTVHRGELIWAVERVPAGVTGNGRDTISALVAEENCNPARKDSIHSPLKPIVIDGEAIAYLATQDLSADAVPEAGQFVPLRRAANVGTGGMPIAVFDSVHPDNAELAVAAAQAIRLDLAGIDLLIPDIAQSWRNTGAGICEINGQPQIGGTTSMHIYPQILQRELRGSGRVPTILLLGPAGREVDLVEVRVGLENLGLSIGWHDAGGVQVDSRSVVKGKVSLMDAGEIMAGNPDVDVMFLTMDDLSVLSTGLPVARYDLAIECGGDIDVPQGMLEGGEQKIFSRIVRTIMPACDGGILAEAGLKEALDSAGIDIEADIKLLESDAPLPVSWLIDCIALLHAEHSGSAT